jgi:hypothetical protein
VRRRFLILLAVFLFGTLSLCSEPRPLPDRLLFIGNSLTSWNDLPRQFSKLAALLHHRVRVDSSLINNYDLGLHLENARSRKLLARAIASPQSALIVLQQGPSSRPENRAALIAWVEQFSAATAGSKASIAIYAVWPSLDRAIDRAAVNESHRLAAEKSGALLFPVGTVFSTIWNDDAATPLLGGDRFHPAPLGTYVAALTIAQKLYGPLPASYYDNALASIITETDVNLSRERWQSIRRAIEGKVSS